MLPTTIPEELEIGIKFYISNTNGINGSIKNFLEDFKVIENSEVEKDENGNILCIVIEKRNINTENVLHFLSKELKIKRKFIGCAGNKDKNAIAIQKISIPFTPEIYKKIENIQHQNFKIIDKFRIKRKIRLGYLKGNSFEIVVRNCNIENNNIEKIYEEIKNGIANYYGYQRFGIKNNNAIVGKFLLTRQYDKVVEILSNDLFLSRIIKKNKNLSSKEILKHIPLYFLNSYIGAYQSLLFNRIVSLRLEKFGLERNENDFVNSKKEVVIPIIGYKVKFPKGEIGEIIEKILEQEKIKKEDFLHEIKPISSKGDFRKFLLKFKNLNYEISKSQNNYQVKFKFDLDKGCYATILLREFCKNKFFA